MFNKANRPGCVSLSLSNLNADLTVSASCRLPEKLSIGDFDFGSFDCDRFGPKPLCSFRYCRFQSFFQNILVCFGCCTAQSASLLPRSTTDALRFFANFSILFFHQKHIRFKLLKISFWNISSVSTALGTVGLTLQSIRSIRSNSESVLNASFNV